MSLSHQAVLGVATIFTSLTMVGIAILVKNRAKKQLAWNRVPAIIIAASVQITNVIAANVEYEYMLEGRKYRSNRIRTLAIDWGFLAGPAQRAVNKYPVGSSIIAFVDPENFQNAVIEPGGDRKFIPFMLVMASIVFYAGVRWILSAAN